MLLGSNGSNLIIDPVRDRLVLFGQSNYLGYANHVWTRSLAGDAEWEPLEISGPYPPAAIAGTSIYDPVRQRMIVDGGLQGGGVWALSLTGTPAWTQLAASEMGPGHSEGIVGVYDVTVQDWYPIVDRTDTTSRSEPAAPGSRPALSSADSRRRW